MKKKSQEQESDRYDSSSAARPLASPWIDSAQVPRPGPGMCGLLEGDAVGRGGPVAGDAAGDAVGRGGPVAAFGAAVVFPLRGQKESQQFLKKPLHCRPGRTGLDPPPV